MQRNREVESLFQRMATVAPASATVAVEEEAARAIRDWPLFAMVTHLRPAPVSAPAQPRHMMMAVDEPSRPQPPLAEPVVAAPAAPTMPVAPAAAPAAPEPQRELSPLEQLFLRAEQSVKSPTFRQSVFEPPATSPAPTLRHETRQGRAAALPPLKTPRPDPAAQSAVTLEPQPRLSREVEITPERLFERVGAR